MWRHCNPLTCWKPFTHTHTSQKTQLSSIESKYTWVITGCGVLLCLYCKWTWHVPCTERKVDMTHALVREKWTWCMPCIERRVDMTCALYWEESGHDTYPVLRGKWTWCVTCTERKVDMMHALYWGESGLQTFPSS